MSIADRFRQRIFRILCEEQKRRQGQLTGRPEIHSWMGPTDERDGFMHVWVETTGYLFG